MVTGKMLTKLERLLDRRAEAKKAITAAEVEVKAIDEALKTMAEDAGGNMETPGWKVTLVQGTSRRLDKQYAYAKVTAKKAKGEAGDADTE